MLVYQLIFKNIDIEDIKKMILFDKKILPENINCSLPKELGKWFIILKYRKN